LRGWILAAKVGPAACSSVVRLMCFSHYYPLKKKLILLSTVNLWIQLYMQAFCVLVFLLTELFPRDQVMEL